MASVDAPVLLGEWEQGLLYQTFSWRGGGMPVEREVRIDCELWVPCSGRGGYSKAGWVCLCLGLVLAV